MRWTVNYGVDSRFAQCYLECTKQARYQIMIVRGLTQQQLTAIARGLSLNLDNLRPVGRTNGHAWAFRIVPESSRAKYARRAASGRRTKATCYHGFRDAITRFFDAGAFSVNTVGQPRLKAGYVGELRRLTIHSVEEFTAMLPDFANRNAGSVYSPVTYAELCECEECDVCHQVYAPGDATRSGTPGHMQTVCGSCIGKRTRDMHAQADAYSARQQGIDVCIECGQPTIPHGARCIAHEQARQARADAYACQQQIVELCMEFECGRPVCGSGSRCLTHEQAAQARADAYHAQQGESLGLCGFCGHRLNAAGECSNMIDPLCEHIYHGGCRVSGCERERKEDSVYCGYHDFCERNPPVCQEPTCRVPMSADRTSCYCEAHNHRCDTYGCMNYVEAPRDHQQYLDGVYCEYHAALNAEYERRLQAHLCQVNGCPIPPTDASVYCYSHLCYTDHRQCASQRCERLVAGRKLFCFEHELRPCQWVECGSLSLTDERYCAAHHYAAFRRQTQTVEA